MSKKDDKVYYWFIGVAVVLAVLSIILPYLLIAVAVAVIIFVGIKIKKLVEERSGIRSEENSFFNRNDCLAKIGGQDFFDVNLTSKILSRQGFIQIDSGNTQAVLLHKSLKKCFSSEKIYQNSCDVKIDNNHNKSIVKYDIKCNISPIVFRFLQGKGREIVFYVYPTTILSFAENETKSKFIGAYRSEFFKATMMSISKEFEVVVPDKSRDDISKYYTYNPVSEAEILYCNWRVTNVDGSRSFKGGLLPEHNPLVFRLKFAQIKYDLGLLSITFQYSNYNYAQEFIDEYKKQNSKTM